MRKICLLLVCALAMPLFGQEPLLLINPFRETFIHFPSSTLPDKIVTIFLPEEKVPLRQKYPVVYVLGAAPAQAQAARTKLEQSGQKAIMVGINVTQKDEENISKLAAFISRELVPYIDTNYPTLDEAKYRVIAAQGAEGARAVAALLARKNLFGKAVLLHPGQEPIKWPALTSSRRMWVGGLRAEIAAVTPALQQAGLSYGAGFVTQLTEGNKLVESLPLDYILAPVEDVQVQRLDGQIIPRVLSLTHPSPLQLTLRVRLVNGTETDYIPDQMAISPLYLHWEPASGELTPIAGSVPGKVKISVFVDKLRWVGKIKLKMH